MVSVARTGKEARRKVEEGSIPERGKADRGDDDVALWSLFCGLAAFANEKMDVNLGGWDRKLRGIIPRKGNETRTLGFSRF